MLQSTAVARRTALVFLGGAAATACIAARTAKQLTVEDVIDRNTRARGGAAALDRVRQVSIDVEIDEGGQKLNGHYAATRDGLARIDVYADGKSVFSEGLDAEGGWFWNGKEIKASNAGGVAALRNGADNNVLGWHRFQGRGHKLTLMPEERIDATSYPVVEILYSTGQRSYFYLDPRTWLAVRRRDERAYHPDVDPTKQRVETRFSAFERVAGVLAPHLDQDFDLAANKLLASHRVLARRVNPELASDHFDRHRRAPVSW